MSDLPAGWKRVSAGELALSMQNGIYRPSDSYADAGVPCLRMYNIHEGRVILRDLKRMALSRQEIEQYGLLPGDILINRVNSRELVGKAAVIPTGLGDLVYESKNIRLRADRSLVNPSYLSYSLLHAGNRYFSNNAQQTVGMASINQTQLSAFSVPLAPRMEQDRIVSEIDKHFSRLDAAVAALKRAQANLKRYRGAVLQAAVEGRLLAQTPSADDKQLGASLLQRILTHREAEWVLEGKRQSYVPPSCPEWVENLPPGWSVATLEQLTSAVRPICYGILMPKEDIPNGVPYVRVVDIQGDRINVSGLRRTSSEIAASYSRASLQAGDLLITIRGSYGRVAEVPGDLAGANITQDTARLALSPLVDRRYIAWALRSHPAGSFMKRVARGVGVKGVNIGDLRRLPIPLPPLAQQERIVAEIERLLSVADDAAGEVKADLKRSRRLRESVLAASFSGRLVPQDPQDEPASVLLERIRTERATAPTKKPNPRRKPALASV